MEQSESAFARNLLKEMALGSAEAFDRFYDRYAALIYYTALKILQDPKEAEDVCHDVFLEIYHHPHRFHPEKGSVKAWLAVLAKSRATDRLRKNRRVLLKEDVRTEQRIAGEKDATEETVFARFEREMLQKALAKIPAMQRNVLVGKYYEFRTQEELARQYKRPHGTIKSMIRYGLKNARKQMKQLGWAERSPGGGDHRS